jgi:hypothetical protein
MPVLVSTPPDVVTVRFRYALGQQMRLKARVLKHWPPKYTGIVYWVRARSYCEGPNGRRIQYTLESETIDLQWGKPFYLPHMWQRDIEPVE